MDGLGGVVVASAVSSVVTVLLWLALAVVIGVTVRGTGRVLGILGCVVPLVAVLASVIFGALTQPLFEVIGYAVIAVFQVVYGLLSVLATILLCAAAVTASRARRATGGLR